MRRPLWIIVALLFLGLVLWQQGGRLPGDAGTPASQAARAGVSPFDPAPESHRAAARSDDATARYPDFLPPEAHDVLHRIASGGPFEYRQDGGVFQNREGRLPRQARGYYREYTVETPGSRDRGARRIVTGGGVPGESPPGEYWYTDDHYRSFRRFEVSR